MKKKTTILALEATGQYLGFSLATPVNDSSPLKKIKTYFKLTSHKQSELLIPTLTSFLKKNKGSLHDLTLLIVDVGPGSFTGVRVGVAAARALAQGLDIPLVGVSSLEALAYQHPFLKKNQTGLLLSKIPALPGESYSALYAVSDKWKSELIGGRLRALIEPQWTADSELSQQMARHTDVVITDETAVPYPGSLLEIGWTRFLSHKKKSDFYYEQVRPLYLQPTWAERKLKNPAA